MKKRINVSLTFLLLIFILSFESFASDAETEIKLNEYTIEGNTFSLSANWHEPDTTTDAGLIFVSESDTPSFISVFCADTGLPEDAAIAFCANMVTDSFDEDSVSIHELFCDDHPVKEIMHTEMDDGTPYAYYYYVFNTASNSSVIAHIRTVLSSDDMTDLVDFIEMLNSFIAPDGTPVGDIGFAS